MLDANRSFVALGQRARRRAAGITRRARAAAARRHRRVLVLGDSHAAVFRHPSWHALPVRLDVRAVGAATLYGLGKPDSASGARGVFDAALAEYRRRPPEAVVTLLGEVDCGFLIWERHRTKGVPLDRAIARAVERYESFLGSVAQIAPPVVVSAPLPTLEDSSKIGDYARLRRTITVPRGERTRLVRSLNAAVAEVCAAHDYVFVDLDDLSTGRDGQVSPLLVSADPHDHHYDPVMYSRLLQRALAQPLHYELPSDLQPAIGSES
jgi:hypothetical protein